MSKLNSLFIFLLLLVTLPLLAQEKQEHQHMAPPPPLNDDFFKWMVGEWKGTTTSPNGVSDDYVKCEMDFGGQFLVMTYKASMKDMQLMSGVGMITLDKEGQPTGYWVDSWRTMALGKGTRQGNVSTMNWSTAEGIYKRTTEKVDENTMKVTGVMIMPDGKEMKSETLLKRIK